MRSTPAWSSASQPMKPPPPTVGRSDVVTAEHVVELPARQGLDLVELVADVDGQDVESDERKRQVLVLGLRVALPDLPVEARRTGDLLDAGAAETDVVAALMS